VVNLTSRGPRSVSEMIYIYFKEKAVLMFRLFVADINENPPAKFEGILCRDCVIRTRTVKSLQRGVGDSSAGPTP